MRRGTCAKGFPVSPALGFRGFSWPRKAELMRCFPGFPLLSSFGLAVLGFARLLLVNRVRFPRVSAFPNDGLRFWGFAHVFLLLFGLRGRNQLKGGV